MKYKKKFKNYLIIVLIFFISIGFAVLTSTLTITGESTFKKNTWEIYFDNVEVLYGDHESIPVINEETRTEVTYDVTLNSPGIIMSLLLMW